MGLDVNVTGSGFFMIQPTSRKGRSWVKRRLDSEENRRQMQSYGGVMCDSGRLVREIVAGMVTEGLRVEVNGVDMTGFTAEES